MEAVKTIKFVVRCEGAEPRVVVIDVVETSIIKIGRDRRSHLLLEDERVSRMHAVLEVSGEGAELIDLGSDAGTFVGDKRVNKCVLSNADMLRMGPYDIQVLFNQTGEDIPEADAVVAESSGSSPDRLVFIVRRDGRVVKLLRSPAPRHGGARLIIGSGSSISPLSLNAAPGVSETHATIGCNASNVLSLMDLGNVSRTTLNGSEITVSDLRNNDIIGIGPYLIQLLINPEEICIPEVGAGGSDQTIGVLIQRGTQVEKKVFPVRIEPGSRSFGLIISRHPDADIQVSGQDIEGVHALICYYNDAFSFANVSTVCPTFLNGEKYDQHMQSSRLGDGDVISAGDYRIQVFFNPRPEVFEGRVSIEAKVRDPADEVAELRRQLAESQAENTMLRGRLDAGSSFSLQGIVDVVSPAVERVAGELKQDLGALRGLLERFRRGGPDKPKI